jgi:membrane protein YqaA with SNARE-associated domain
MALGNPKKSFFFSGATTFFSVLGGIFGYFLGLLFIESVGMKIIEFYGLSVAYLDIQSLYREYDALAVFLAGFTPIPYKVFTIAAGAFQIDFLTFVLASLVSRGARFFIEGALIWRFGEAAKVFIERYLNVLAIAFGVLLVAGFIIMRMFL